MSIPVLSSSPTPGARSDSRTAGGAPSTTSASSATATATTAIDGTTSNEAAAKLAEAIDDFLGDIEKKFKGISDEILNKLDDMAERCDRLEQEMLLRDASSMDGAVPAAGVKASGGSPAGSI